MRRFRLLLAIGGLGLSLTAGGAYAQPQYVRPGPQGGCPAGYYTHPGWARCWLHGNGPSDNAGPPDARWTSPGPEGGCPRGYYRPPGWSRCWLNGQGPPAP
jgi:hypothetical protein